MIVRIFKQTMKVIRLVNRWCRGHLIAVIVVQASAIIGLVIFDWILGYDWYGNLFMLYMIVILSCTKLLELYGEDDKE